MNRDVAIRIDAMMIGGIAYLDGVAHYMKNNLSDEEYQSLILMIGAAMAEHVALSSRLHAEFPDIIPKELQPGS